ncbi:GTP-binding protein [Gemmiger sp.]|uniref:GTP-binding protein n=1 Tax=Gemmiger sp. TaxID=2049027 RepID=UPI003AF18FBF
MVQVDLITGFLGSGKTTFLRKYVQYLVAQGHNVCILENDFGAVNVDAILLQDLIGDNCDLETISGGCDCDTHQRRMRTKLISMAMRGFDRVVIEPSGIFDVDEFYDILRDEPLDHWYRLGSVIAIVDAKLESELSPQADYLLASEAASAGLVVMSRVQQAGAGECAAVVDHLNHALEGCHCARRFGEDVLCKDWTALTDADFARIDGCGWRQTSYVKLHFDEHEAFTSLYFLKAGRTVEQIKAATQLLLHDAKYGHILRIKGFIPDGGGWVELNAARDTMTVQKIAQGQEVLIVIGEGLEKEAIERVIKG